MATQTRSPDKNYPETRKRSGNRKGDYAPYLEAPSDPKDTFKKFKNCCSKLREEEKLKNVQVENSSLPVINSPRH